MNSSELEKQGDSRLTGVLFVIGELTGGGAERVLSVMSGQFAELGVASSVGLINSRGTTAAYALNQKVALIDFSRDSARGHMGLPKSLLRLRRYVKSEKPDVIIPFMLHNALLTLGACVGLRRPIVIRPATVPVSRSLSSFARRTALGLLPKAHGAFFQIPAQQAFLQKYLCHEGVILPNPIEPSSLWDLRRSYGNKTIISAGRLNEGKNFMLLIEAFSALAEEFPEWKLVICGEGPSRDGLQTEIERLRLTQRIALPGFSDDISALLHEASVFAMSSRYEGMPNALMEAMCLGCACVTTEFDGGAARMLINDGENGLIVPNDDVKRFTEALRRLMQSEALRETLGQNAAELKTTANARQVAARWISYLQNVISSP